MANPDFDPILNTKDHSKGLDAMVALAVQLDLNPEQWGVAVDSAGNEEITLEIPVQDL